MSATKPLAVYTESSDFDVDAGVALLENGGFDVRVLDTRDTDEIVASAADAEVLLVGYAHVTRSILERLPKLRLVSLMSMGTDNVDVAAATEHGVWVTNVPGAATEEVATHALALLLHSVRQLGYYTTTAVADAQTWNSRAAVAPWRLSEHTLGVLGLGRIGRKFAELAGPLFRNVVGYDPLLPDDNETRAMLAELGIARVSLEQARSAANVLSLHVPLTPDTENLIDETFVRDMPEGAFVLNVSRGALIDAEALVQAVISGRLSGAALDVLDDEPPDAGHPLLDVPGIVLTPHVAYYSERTDAEYVRIQAENAVKLLASGKPESPVNDIPFV